MDWENVFGSSNTECKPPSWKFLSRSPNLDRALTALRKAEAMSWSIAMHFVSRSLHDVKHCSVWAFRLYFFSLKMISWLNFESHYLHFGSIGDYKVLPSCTFSKILFSTLLKMGGTVSTHRCSLRSFDLTHCNERASSSIRGSPSKTRKCMFGLLVKRSLWGYWTNRSTDHLFFWAPAALFHKASKVLDLCCPADCMFCGPKLGTTRRWHG